MGTTKENVLESADMQDNGAIVTFGDGKFAFYSGELLRSILPQAQALEGTSEDALHDANWKPAR